MQNVSEVAMHRWDNAAALSPQGSMAIPLLSICLSEGDGLKFTLFETVTTPY